MNDMIKTVTKKSITAAAELVVVDAITNNRSLEELNALSEKFATLCVGAWGDAISRVKDKMKHAMTDRVIEDALLKPLIKDK